jgi:SAM-dependent methyltransferase
MLQWYRGQIKQHGPINATRLLWRIGWSRLRVDVANKLLAGRLECPCCGWQGRRFHGFIELDCEVPNTVCPRCESHARHRAFYLWLSREYDLQDRAGVALVFAAEPALAPLWNNAERLRVYRVDIDANRGRDLQADLTRLPIADSAVDLIWCHHVLEHIEDDRSAIRELYRVLRPEDGELIVSVPMIAASRTEEYGFCDQRRAGHWRIYGDDFAERLSEIGFLVGELDYQPPAADCARYGITAEQLYICTKSGSPT